MQKIKIIFDDEKIKKILKIKDVIKTVEEGFRKKGLGLVSLPPKIGPKLGVGGAFADAMSVSAFNEKKKLETFGIKWICGFPENIEKGLPYLNSIIILNEPNNGFPIAILKGNWITAMRTAGVSAVCAKYLAPRKKEITIGIFGLGTQAYVHVLAFKEIFKKVKFLLYEHDKKFLEDFLKKFPKENFLSCNNFHEVVNNSDVILSVTTFPKKISPYIYAKDLKDDVLILPVDYGTRIDPKLYTHIDEIYTDDIAQYNLKSKLRNYFPKEAPKIKTEIGEVVKRGQFLRTDPKRIMALNLGIALFDILTAKLLRGRI